MNWILPEWREKLTMVLSVQLLSHVWLFATPWTVACQASLSNINSQSLLTHVHWVSDAIQHSSVIPFSSCLQSLPASGSFLISQLFASGGQSIWSFISPSCEYSGLISFRIDWFDLLAGKGTLKSLLQHHSLKASILQHSRLPCPSPSPGACSNSCPLNQWCHTTISSSVDHFSCPESFPTSGSFLMSRLFTSGGQSIGVSASA